MSNSRRWREFITWWNNLDYKGHFDKKELIEAIEKKIEEIKGANP